MVEHTSISTAEAAILTESALDSDGFAHLRRPYNGVWVGDIKMFRNLGPIADSCTTAKATLFDHLVGAGE